MFTLLEFSGKRAAAPHRTFRAWLVLRLGPPPQPPRRYFSKSLSQGRFPAPPARR